jgi:hypothetical protein
MKKEEGLGGRQATKCGAKRQARTCPVTTPQQLQPYRVCGSRYIPVKDGELPESQHGAIGRRG